MRNLGILLALLVIELLVLLALVFSCFRRKLTRLYRCQNRCDARKLRIKIAGICGTGDLRLERWVDSLVIDIIPVDVSEEWLAHDFLCISRSTSKTLVGFSREKLLQDRD